MPRDKKQRTIFKVTATISVTTFLLFTFFLLHGRFSPSLSVVYAGAFVALIAGALYKCHLTGSEEPTESIDLIESVTKEDHIDLRYAERSNESPSSSIHPKLVTLLVQLRTRISKVVQTLHQYTYNFYRMEREFGVFHKSFASMIEKIHQASDDGHRVNQATETQYATSQELTATAQELAHLSEQIDNTVRSVSGQASNGNQKLQEVEHLFLNTRQKIKDLNDKRLFFSNQMGIIQGAIRSVHEMTHQAETLSKEGLDGALTIVAEEVEKLAWLSQSVDEDLQSMSDFIENADETVHEVMTEIGDAVSNIQGVNRFTAKMASNTHLLGNSSEELSLSAETVSQSTAHMESLLLSVEADVNGLSKMLTELTAVAHGSAKDSTHIITELRNIKVTNEEDFIQAGVKAVQAHRDWVIGLRESIDTGILKVETNPKRCRFGVFLSLVECPPSVPHELWDTTLRLHDKLHKYGHDAEHAIEEGDLEKANVIYEKAQSLSITLIKLIEQLIMLCQKSLLQKPKNVDE